MTYEEYETRVLTALKELRDGAVYAEETTIIIRALENIYSYGKDYSVPSAAVKSGCCVTEEADEGPVDPQALLEEYIDLPDDDLRMHYTSCKEAMLRRLGSKAGDLMDTDATLTITESVQDGAKNYVRQWERNQIEGAVFVTLRVQAQLASAAATALIPGTSRMSREDFLQCAAEAYSNTVLLIEHLVSGVVKAREAEMNPPPPKPGIVDVG